MKIKYFIIMCIVIMSLVFSTCKDNSTEPQNDNRDTTVVAFKPNLYLYPTSKVKITVRISFPLGGKLLKSIPDYKDGWDIVVDTNGLINDYYSYLFYEYEVPDYHQKEKGWLVEKTELGKFFNDNMKTSGFNETEIKDFIEYWIPRLNEYDYYEIYPQYKSLLNQMTKIDFTSDPDNFYRLQYLIKGTNQSDVKIEEPEIEIASRKDFHVLEWGVILK